MIKAEKRSREEEYNAFGMKAKTKNKMINEFAEDKTNLDSMRSYDHSMSASEYAELLEEDMYA